MNIKELMVGDWVKNDLGEIQQVVELQERGVMLFYNDIYPYEDIEAIPLTPDFFLKNGFAHGDEKDLKDEYVFAENLKQIPQTVAEYTFYKHPVMGCDSLLRCWTKCKDGDGQNDVHICNIRYVHELQHAFRFLGIDKDLNP